MNDNKLDKSPEVMDSGWLRFWITFSSICLLLSLFIPDVHMLKNRYVLTWFWESTVVTSPGYHGASWVYLLLGTSVLMLVLRSLFDGKYLAAMTVFILTLVAFLLLTIGEPPKTSGLWSYLRPSWLVLLISASGLILAGTHLYKIFPDRGYPRVILVTGALLLGLVLFIPAGLKSQSGLVTGLISAGSWKGSPLVSSIVVLLLILVALLGLAAFKYNVQRGLSIFLRLIFLAVPAMVFLYLYFQSGSAASASLATTGFEAAQQTLWIYGFFMYPAAVASLIEWNTLFE